MKITFSILALGASALFSVMASPSAENAIVNEQSNVVLKRSGSRGGDRRHGRGRGRGYNRFGRNWYFDTLSDSVFISSLRYRPTFYYGQRFQFLFQNSPVFSNYWNNDDYFRSCWNKDNLFRDAWFSTLYPIGYSKFRTGGIYYNYFDRFGYSRRGGHRRGHRGGHGRRH
ncbi:hypothetical protein AYI69_g6163 [Smittium culicis]|uniref:Uncharacterized protein n=1 Tax=Smittium culicis TaxID=133412 RepID=A0A1R1Y0V0_9FUNG|nr:hypothetical protein AYI69_g6163 [Smittium culicis]